MSREHNGEQPILTASVTDVAGNIIDVSDFRHMIITLNTAGMGTGDTINCKIQASIADTAPDFDAAITASNRWFYLESIDLNDETAYIGSDGVPLTDSLTEVAIAANTNGAKWLTILPAISDKSGTSITAKVALYND